MRSRYAGQPFTTSTADIAAALEQVSIPTLLLSLVHITGDPRFVRDFKQAGVFLNEVQGFMSDDDKARARAEALPVIVDYRDRGCPELDPLSSELVEEMVHWAACETVPDDYLALLAEEMDLDGVDPRRPEPLDPDNAAHLPIVVIGCGESGVLAGIRLRQANIPFTIVEKNAGPGGTWWENNYPGARVDVANHFYCYSFEPSNEWTHFFAEQPELQNYFETLMDKHSLDEHVRWQTEVIAAEWDDEDGIWTVTLREPDEGLTTLQARAVITAVGQLNRPNIPQSRRQDVSRAGVSLRGVGPLGRCHRQARRADRCGRQRFPDRAGHRRRRRTPHRFPAHRPVDVPQPDVSRRGRRRRALGDGPSALLRTLVPIPGAVARSDKGLDAARVDPAYPDQDYAVSEINADRPDDVHRLDHQSGRRRRGTAGQGAARLPGHRQADAAGQRHLAAHAAPRPCRLGAHADRSHHRRRRRHRRRRSATTSISSSTPPVFGTPTCCGRWRSPAETVSTCTAVG